ncbi:DUF2225 domain-containing protein [[Clostridium] fimetarium]|uniref:DUF2225 domain-containing protein n=1 Tax=[Clostridium] fimetarium TaxID=99656 RepID=A0A1I0NJJ0_9FIRM|nr:DUF2225 domain-containing protein [[Clostridium] fimetarium]SEW01671.1 hypothetical protein SAMN05421659_103162 [[Clostridium] fimetarium]
MDNLLFGLEELGITKTNGVDIFGEEKGDSRLKTKIEESTVSEQKESDFLFEKTMTCPVCDKSFKTKQVKIGKPRFIGTDSDLRPRYEGVDTVKYDAVVCLHCGYAELMRNFNSISSRQIKDVKENICNTFKGITNELGEYSYPAALQRYKLALYNGVVKHSKLSERAFICLKIAWLYRAQIESLSKDTEDYAKVAREYAINELMFTKNAYEGFFKAIEKEMPPICGMDETTVNYMLSDLARRCQDYENAEKFAFAVLSSRSASAKIKEKTRAELEIIKKEKASSNK